MTFLVKAREAASYEVMDYFPGLGPRRKVGVRISVSLDQMVEDLAVRYGLNKGEAYEHLLKRGLLYELVRENGGDPNTIAV